MANRQYRIETHLAPPSSVEDYLEAIIVLSREMGGDVRVTELSERLGVSKPSVSVAVRKLTQAGFVEHEPYGAVQLTPAGKERATAVAMRHNLLHRFLTEILGVNESPAQADACAMEHGLSKETVDRLAQFVEFLTSCPRSEPAWHKGFSYYIEHGKHHPDLTGE